MMAPLSLAGGMLQGPSGVDDRVLPLVMLGPALAWLACRFCVPGWFPRGAPERAARPGVRTRAAVATLAVCAAFVATLCALVPAAAPVLPTRPRALAVLAVCGGLLVGSWAEEVGYRGVLYRALSARLAVGVNVVANGVFFGLCHLQYLGEPIGAVLFVGGTVLMDVAMAAVWDGSWRLRIASATAIHTVVNVALQLRGFVPATPGDFVRLAVAMAAAALTALLVGRGLGVGDLTPTRRQG